MRPCIPFSTGFTLAELLICMTILGEIATFTIPKILSSQQNGQYNAQAKEAIATISAAYQMAQKDGIVKSSMTSSALKPYINYVSDYTNLIDSYPTQLSIDCNDGSYTCVKLHSGGVLMFDWDSFGGTGPNNAIIFAYDPDSVFSNTLTGNSKSLLIFLYYNGRISTYGNISAGTSSSHGWPGTACTSCEPSWFKF